MTALGFAVGRVAYAVAVVIAPRQAAGPWLGEGVSSGGTRVAARALVARDAFLAIGLAAAASREAPVKPWLAALIASDLSDIAATLADRDHLPKQAALGTILIAGAAAGTGVALFAAADE